MRLGAFVAVAGIAFAAIVWQVGPNVTRVEPWPNAWYYDLNTKKTFVSRITNLPPMPAPSGPTPKGQPAGVWARVYACGSCEREGDRFVAWIEKLTPETKKQLADVLVQFKDGHRELDPFDAVNLWDQEGLLLAPTDNNDLWMASTSDEADAMKRESLARCGEGVSPLLCPPVGDAFEPHVETETSTDVAPHEAESAPIPSTPLPELVPDTRD